jgi:hypothetical protein
MLRRVALVRTDDSEELSTSFIRVTRIGELGTTLAVTNNQRTILVTLMKEALTGTIANCNTCPVGTGTASVLIGTSADCN